MKFKELYSEPSLVGRYKNLLIIYPIGNSCRKTRYKCKKCHKFIKRDYFLSPGTYSCPHCNIHWQP